MDKLIVLAVILQVHLYRRVDSMDSNNSMQSTQNNNTTGMLQSNVSNAGETDTVGLSENNFDQVMKKCNASYQTPISYMEEMNMTGSYPDETEKLPMCFMKCYLENTGALSSDNIMNMKQAILHFATSDDVINSCLLEQSEIDSLDSCEYAYFLARCIMMATLVDNRKSDT